MLKVTIRDQNGVPRCWAEGQDTEQALKQAVKVCSEYYRTTGRIDLELSVNDPLELFDEPR